jgi:hypothetical protein
MRPELRLILCALILVACSDAAGLATGVSEDAGTGSDDVLNRIPDIGKSDADNPPEDCKPGEDCMMETCNSNSDCQSEYCVDHLGDSVCTQTCIDECPNGFSCKGVEGIGTDVAFICVSNATHLCRPCSTPDDCKSTLTGAQDACLDFGTAGQFCGALCSVSEDCPTGYSCGDAVNLEGVSIPQCVPDSGSCECPESAKQLGLIAPCKHINEHGTCTGQRACSSDGLSDCDALTPAAETCDGLDNNCDGQLDNPSSAAPEDANLDCDENATCIADTDKSNCVCNNGYLGDGKSCNDVDECTEDLKNCDANALCENTVGGFTCSCHIGYSGDGTACTLVACPENTQITPSDAINGCPDGTIVVAGKCLYGVPCDDDNPCADEHICESGFCFLTNEDGAMGSQLFEAPLSNCGCLSGYQGEITWGADSQSYLGECTNSNECETESDNCDVNATCTDTAGGFDCACNSGYDGDGVICTNIDECATDTDKCDDNAVCTDTDGASTCACDDGYTGDGFTCATCADGTYDDDGEPFTACVACYSCDAGSFTTSTCTATTNTECSACTPPGAGLYVSEVCDPGSATTPGTDTAVSACTPPEAGQYVSSICSAGSIDTAGADTAVSACTPPEAGQYVSSICSAGSIDTAGADAGISVCTAIIQCASELSCTTASNSICNACNAGYGLSSDKATCSDINECTTNNPCDSPTKANCQNTTGSFTCSCKSGYSGNGFNCQDINECTQSPCKGFSACTNTVGSFTCTNVASQCSGSSKPGFVSSSCYHCTVPGSFSFKTPNTWKNIDIRVYGAGGGAAINNCFGNKCFFGSGGGGGGGYAQSSLSPSNSQSFNFFVGQGAGGGKVGGKSSFNNDQLFATGGQPGNPKTDAGGPGGQGSKGNVSNQTGGTGGSGGTGNKGIFKFGSAGVGINGVGNGAAGEAAAGGYAPGKNGAVIICPK